MVRYVSPIMMVVLGSVIGALVLYLFLFYDVPSAWTRGVSGVPEPSVSYSDLAAINLTAATVTLAAVAVVITVAAVFGFQVIRSESVSAAEKWVAAEVPSLVERQVRQMEKDGRLTKALERAIYSTGENGEEASHIRNGDELEENGDRLEE